MTNKTLNIIGVMSGSSMDGLDVALCKFSYHKKQIHYNILKSETLSYSKNIIQLLQNIRNTSSEDFFEKDVIYGKWIGKKIHHWIQKHHLKVDTISIHGHTAFHYPEKGFSVQLGNAAQIASICQKPVIHNFRNLDIAFGGQGAPLVPIGDKLLFHQYDACINIGGIANIFIQKNSTAFDICIANLALNHFAEKLNFKYDKNGHLARRGKVHQHLLKKLNELKYLKLKPPKSLNREYFENDYLNVIRQFKDLNNYDILSTLTEHIAFQIAQSISKPNIKNVLITGGGALNNYLIKRIMYYAPDKNIVIPDKTLVKFKEALIFALLGYLRILQIPNNVPLATGAQKNICAGEIVYI